MEGIYIFVYSVAGRGTKKYRWFLKQIEEQKVKKVKAVKRVTIVDCSDETIVFDKKGEMMIIIDEE